MVYFTRFGKYNNICDIAVMKDEKDIKLLYNALFRINCLLRFVISCYFIMVISIV